jgi:hypothetical protein
MTSMIWGMDIRLPYLRARLRPSHRRRGRCPEGREGRPRRFSDLLGT